VPTLNELGYETVSDSPFGIGAPKGMDPAVTRKLHDAFKATLQEAVDADLLLHVVDASNPNFPEQIAQVQAVLQEIGAAEVPQILVFNKIDALASDAQPVRMVDTYEVDGLQCPRVFISARAMIGLPGLRDCLSQAASGNGAPPPAVLPEAQGLTPNPVPLNA
jgi:GTP-binding protein HflX